MLESSLNSVVRHPASLPVEKLLAECKIERTRSGGPGGQHRNKVETAVVISHLPSGVSGQAGERRSQHQNREVAVQRLRINLALAVRCPREHLSELWNSRRRGTRIDVNRDHADFPAILAEALDVLAMAELEPAAAAVRLGISSSQLVKLLRVWPAALEGINRKRIERGQHPLS